MRVQFGLLTLLLFCCSIAIGALIYVRWETWTETLYIPEEPLCVDKKGHVLISRLPSGDGMNLWSLTRLQPMAQIRSKTVQFVHAAFYEKDERFVSVTNIGAIQIWDFNGVEVANTQTNVSDIYWVSPKSAFIIAWRRSGAVLAIDPYKKHIQEFTFSKSSNVSASFDGRYVVVDNELFSSGTGEVLAPPDNLRFCVLSPTKNHAVLTDNERYYLWNLDEKKIEAQTKQLELREPTAVQFNDTGRYLWINDLQRYWETSENLMVAQAQTSLPNQQMPFDLRDLLTAKFHVAGLGWWFGETRDGEARGTFVLRSDETPRVCVALPSNDRVSVYDRVRGNTGHFSRLEVWLGIACLILWAAKIWRFVRG